MDFMNLNQSAHGDREYGFMQPHRKPRKVVVGHWQDSEVQSQLDVWMRAAAAWHDAQGARLARIGDNMRGCGDRGDKVEAQMRFGYSVNGYGVGDLAAIVDGVSESEVDALVAEYDALYDVRGGRPSGGPQRGRLRGQAQIELGMRRFLEGSRASPPASKPCTACLSFPAWRCSASWGRLWLRRRRRLEDRRPRPRDEGHGRRPARGHLLMEDYTYHLNPAGMKVLGPTCWRSARRWPPASPRWKCIRSHRRQR